MTTTTPVTPAARRPAGAARNPWAVLAVLCLGLFMILLDGTIVNIAIPHIQSYYDTTYSNIEWVMNAFLISGVGIGFAVAPVTSAVMATAPKERVGNASGVLSTTRQVGSLMGIAILGAVLQNRAAATITEGVQAISQLPEAAKQKIIAAADSGSLQMGIPDGGSSMPAVARAMMETMFKGWFTDAIASTFVVAVVLAVIGGLCALLLRSHVKDAEESAADVEEETAMAETAVPEVDAA